MFKQKLATDLFFDLSEFQARIIFTLSNSYYARMAVKVIAVMGAAGVQGGSVVDAMEKVPGWRVSVLTRTPGSEKAKKLADKGFEVVKADADDETSMIKAFEVCMFSSCLLHLYQ